jgi:fatty acid synthase
MNSSVDDEIVISGIAGRFPNSRNLREFSHNLYNKVDMTDEAESRWKHIYDENLLPRRMGKIPNIEKFDASFFSLTNKTANIIDPQGRILLEHAYEAILDAGISPQSLIGTQTGVFIGCSTLDSRDFYTKKNISTGAIGFGYVCPINLILFKIRKNIFLK